MNDDRPALYEAVLRQVLHLRWVVQEHDRLFTDESIPLLEETAPSLFRLIQRLMLREMVLAICRLLDPAVQGSYENASLERLVDGLPDLPNRVENLRKKAKPLRFVKDKILSHSDLEWHRKPSTKLSDLTLVDPLKTEILDLLNDPKLREAVGRPDSEQHWEIAIDGDAADLVAFLQDAISHHAG